MFGKKKPVTSVIAGGKLIDGLPAPAYTPAAIRLDSSGFQISLATGQKKEDQLKFNLSLEKVVNIQLMDERQIENVIKQSAPGMILGAATFGIVGALVGGRAKTKKKVVISKLLVIDYESNGSKQIVFDVSHDSITPGKMIDLFRSLKPVDNSPVEL